MTDVNDDFVIIDSDFVQTTRRNRKSRDRWKVAPFRPCDGKDETRFYLSLYQMWERRNKGSNKENPYDKYLEGRLLYEIALESVFTNVSDVEKSNPVTPIALVVVAAPPIATLSYWSRLPCGNILSATES